MSTKKSSVSNPKSEKSSLVRIGFILASAILTSAAIIIYTSDKGTNFSNFGSIIELASLTLMPYMISAVIAAITALCIMNIIPMENNQEASEEICERLKMVAVGDLTGETRLKKSNAQMNEIANELNYSITQLNSTMAKIKIINRQQWDILQSIKSSTVSSNFKTVMDMIDKMEENWSKIVELEETIKT